MAVVHRFSRFHIVRLATPYFSVGNVAEEVPEQTVLAVLQSVAPVVYFKCVAPQAWPGLTAYITTLPCTTTTTTTCTPHRMQPAPGSAALHCGYGFADFETPQQAAEARSRLNGYSLAGKPLRVTELTNPAAARDPATSRPDTPEGAAVAAQGAAVAAKIAKLSLADKHRLVAEFKALADTVPDTAAALLQSVPPLAQALLLAQSALGMLAPPANAPPAAVGRPTGPHARGMPPGPHGAGMPPGAPRGMLPAPGGMPRGPPSGMLPAPGGMPHGPPSGMLPPPGGMPPGPRAGVPPPPAAMMRGGPVHHGRR